MKEKSKAQFDLFRQQFKRYYSIGDLAPTLCELFGLPVPDCCGGTAIAPVVDQAARIMDGEGKVEKAVLFCADALGDHQREHFTQEFAKIQRTAGLRIESVSVMPSVTPVCYGTIFTGAAPCVHGINCYEKPVLKVETLFDVFAASGRRAAILSQNECSIDRIFRNREVDYYSFRNDTLAFDWTRELIRKDGYDLIVCYMGDYDMFMHKRGCFSLEGSEKARIAADRFEILAKDLDEYCSKYNRVLVFVPDHGAHTLEDGHGTHGTDQKEDMLVSHYYRLMEKKEDQ